MHQDEEYKAAGAELADIKGAFQQDIVMKVRPPTDNEVGLLKDNST